MACASGQKPTEQLTTAKAAIRGAVESGAKDTPQGALYLKKARDQTEEAEAVLAKDGDVEFAKHLLVRAEADGNLAIVLSKQAAAENEMKEAKRRLEALKKDE